MFDNCKECEKIDGISCKVSNCKYHSTNDCCHAGHITVGPGRTDCCEGTECSTFEAK